MICEKCGAELAEGSLYCEKCGARAEPDVVWDIRPARGARTACPYCGRDVLADDVYCGFCGRNLAAEPVTDTVEEEKPAAGLAEEEKPAADPAEEEESEPVAAEEEEAGSEPVIDTIEEEEPEPVAPEDAQESAEELEEAEERPEVYLAEKAAERLKRFSYLAPVAAGLLFLLVLTSFLYLFVGDRTEEAAQTKLIYYHEDALYLADLTKEDVPAEITDSCLDVGVPPYEGLVSGDRINGTGDWLFWREEYDGETFDLYRMSLANGSGKEKLASNVSSYQTAADGTVLFERGGSLYYCDGGEPDRLGRNVLSWRTDREGRLVCWMEKSGESGNVCYLQNVADGSEKAELDKNVTAFYASDGLNRFMSLKGGVLYLLDASGEKERIAQNVVSVESCDLDEDRVYYMTENPVRLAYTDVVSDNEGVMTEEDWLYVSDLSQFEIPYLQLRYHWPKGDSEVSDRCFSVSRESTSCISEAGAYCIYREGPRIEELKADWTEFKGRLGGDDFGACLLEALDGKGQFSGLRLAAEGRTFNEYEETALPDGREDVCYDKENRNLYLYMVLDGEEQGTLYKIPLTGGNAGEPAAVDDGLDGIGEMTAADGGIYYIRDPGKYGGDLYFNGQEIAYDVSGIWLAGDRLAYIYDYDRNSSGDADFSLAIYRDGKKTVAGKEILCADCASDGTAVMLADFDSLKGEGSLLYFDGKDTRVLAEQVTGFVPRNKAAHTAAMEVSNADYQDQIFYGQDRPSDLR